MTKRTTSKTSAKPTKPVERKLTREAIDRLNETRERIMRGRVFTDDSTDIVRRFRDGRTSDSVTTHRGQR